MKYLIADVVTEFTPKSDRLKNFSKPFEYTGERSAELVFDNLDKITQSFLPKMKKGISYGETESFALSNLFNRAAVKFNTMLVHSSALICDGKAYLFSADSGVGKSTHTKLWCDAFGDKVHIMNDDKPVVRIYDDKVIAYGTPFDGGSGIALNEAYPLGAIIFIERGEKNSIRVPNNIEILQQLYFSTAHMLSRENAEFMLNNFDMLIPKAKFYILTCNMGISAAHFAYNSIIEDKM